MFEDAGLELDLLPRGRIFCIASGGCTAFALAARGDDVTAVDVNPVQIDYVRSLIDGGPRRAGRIDRGFVRARRLAPALGWTRSRLERFCALDDPERQLDVWRRELDTRRLQTALAVALAPTALRRGYAAPFVAVLPPRFDRVLRRRFERTFARHPNATNPYAAALLLGRPVEIAPRPLRLETADAAGYLERCPPASFGGFSLSNILDGADGRYAARLWAAVRRAAAPGAVAILRTFGEPATNLDAEHAAADRSLLWGSIRIERVG